MNPTTPLIQMKQLNKLFEADGNSISALKNINLTVQQGDYLSIQGPSGGGKSTLLSLLGLLDRASSGEYCISGVSVSQLNPSQMAKVRNREIGFIFQEFNLIGDLNVSQNVELPLIYRGMKHKERRERVAEVLSKVNMSSRSSHLPTQLSGGQQQRVAIARALAGTPSLLLADEPTGNLDSVNGDSVMHLLSDLNNQGVTICMVTHDSRYADYASKIVHLFDGQIVEPESSKASSLVDSPISQLSSATVTKTVAKTEAESV